MNSPGITAACASRPTSRIASQVAGAAWGRARAAAAVDVDDALVAELGQVAHGQPRAERLVGLHAVDGGLRSSAAGDHHGVERVASTMSRVSIRGLTMITPSVRYSSSASSIARSRSGRRPPVLSSSR